MNYNIYIYLSDFVKTWPLGSGFLVTVYCTCKITLRYNFLLAALRCNSIRFKTQSTTVLTL